MNRILQYAIEQAASDIHITEEQVSWVRIRGELHRWGEPVSLAAIDEWVELFVPNVQTVYAKLRSKQQMTPIDSAFQYASRRFRMNVYRGMNGINLALRLLSNRILPLHELYLPEALKQFTKLTAGLFLVAGTTGSGKSTTLASMLDHINHSRSENILTVEQPIEYIHTPDLCRITQMEVGVHTESFAAATVAAMRQNPNILLVGELRDLETMQNAVTLAETGHVVYATLHAKSVTDTIDRMVDVFPPKQQEQIRLQLSGVLRGILHQRLLRGSGGMVPLVELLAVDDVIAAMIAGKQKANSIRDHLRSKVAFGNVHAADNAAWHIQNGRISLEAVMPYLSRDDCAMTQAIVGTETTRRGLHGKPSF